MIRGERIGWQRLREAYSSAWGALPRDHGHLAALEGSYGYIRQFTPQVLEAVRFSGGTAATELMQAVEILTELNATGARKVPAHAPTGLVPTRWRGYLDEAATTGNSTAYRHYWELCTLLALRDGLRTGDVFVPDSRRYSDPAAYLLTPQAWAQQRGQFCRLVGKFADAATALAEVEDELHTALGELEQTLADGDGPVRLDEAGELVISLLAAEDIPAEAVALKDELTEMLPFAPIVSLLIELDQRTRFLDWLYPCRRQADPQPRVEAHPDRSAARACHQPRAHAHGRCLRHLHDILAFTAEWYVQEESLRAANLALIGYHQQLPLTANFGSGTLSSSDGQRFPTRGKSVTARALSRYFAHEGLSTYTHVTDQHTTYGTKVIVATQREAHYVLDDILGNATDIPITEHATDTHGVTLVNFGLFDLLGLQLSPRIRNLGKITLYRTRPKSQVQADFPLAGPLLTRRANLDLIAEH